MTIAFRCPNCDARLGASTDAIAERIDCPRCHSQLLVPDPTEARIARDDAALRAEEATVSFRREGDQGEVEMDMTPMVDVTFLLLIFFMVTAAFSLQKSFEVPTPKEDRPSSNVATLDDFADDPDYIVIRIDENSTFYVSAANWDEDREAPSIQDLHVALTDARRGSDRGIPTRLLIVAHGNARHEQVVAALDAGNDVGINEVKLVTVEDDV